MALAPFYLEEFLGKSAKGAKRVVFLETDTVVLGDLGELARVDMQGHPCGAAKTCSRHWADLMNFEELKGQGSLQLNPNSCVASRAVLVIDFRRWRKQQVSKKIEEWMARYQNAAGELWTGGMAHVPWLLALGDGYAELGEPWVCGGLGRDMMSPEESQAIRRGGFDKRGLKRLGTQIDELGNINPYLATCSGAAKLLQFDGAMAPWRLDRFDSAPPICMLPAAAGAALPGASSLAAAGVRVRVFCEWTTFVNCSALWSSYISEELACALKDFEQEWEEAEETWANRRHDRDWTMDVEKMQQDDEVDATLRQQMTFLNEEEKKVTQASKKQLAQMAKKERIEREKADKKRLEEERKEAARRDKMIREREAQLEQEEQRRVDQERLARIQKTMGRIPGVFTPKRQPFDTTDAAGAATGAASPGKPAQQQGQSVTEAGSGTAGAGTGGTAGAGAGGGGTVIQMQAKDFDAELAGQPQR